VASTEDLIAVYTCKCASVECRPTPVTLMTKPLEASIRRSTNPPSKVVQAVSLSQESIMESMLGGIIGVLSNHLPSKITCRSVQNLFWNCGGRS
jgi:hypothetical protein